MAKTLSNAVARRMRDTVRETERDRRDFGGVRWPARTGFGAEHFVISDCASGHTGVVKIKKSAAPGSATPESGAEEELAWLGADAFLGQDMPCWAIPCFANVAGTDVSWLILDSLVGAAHWKDPTTDGSTLASLQDNPAAATLCDG